MYVIEKKCVCVCVYIYIYIYIYIYVCMYNVKDNKQKNQLTIELLYIQYFCYFIIK